MAHPPDSRNNPPDVTAQNSLKARLGKARFAAYMDGSNDGLNLVDLSELSESIRKPKDPSKNRGES